MNKNIYIAIIVFLLGIVAGGLLFKDCSHKVERVVEIQKDTLWKTDTVTIDLPQETKKVTLKETLLVEVRDTLWLHDTLYMSLPLEKRVYQREEFYAEVAGYDPRLIKIEVYPKTAYVTKVEKVAKTNRLSFGAEAGYFTFPYIPIYLEYSRMLHKNVEFYVRAMYDIPSASYGASVGAKLQVGW